MTHTTPEKYRKVWEWINNRAKPGIYALDSPIILPERDTYIEAIKEWIGRGYRPEMDFNNSFTKFRILPRLDMPRLNYKSYGTDNKKEKDAIPGQGTKSVQVAQSIEDGGVEGAG